MCWAQGNAVLAQIEATWFTVPHLCTGQLAGRGHRHAAVAPHTISVRRRKAGQNFHTMSLWASWLSRTAVLGGDQRRNNRWRSRTAVEALNTQIKITNGAMLETSTGHMFLCSNRSTDVTAHPITVVRRHGSEQLEDMALGANFSGCGARFLDAKGSHGVSGPATRMRHHKHTEQLGRGEMLDTANKRKFTQT
jgi:hypothetical protein